MRDENGIIINERDTISFTPAPGRQWVAHFKDAASGEEWELPVVGWALVHHIYDGDEGAENKIDPVVLDEGKYVKTVQDYCDSYPEHAYIDLYQGLRPQEADEASSTSLRLTSDGPGSRGEIIDYVRSVIEQRTTLNDDTDAERLARGIVTSILSRLGAGFSIAVGSQPQEGDV